jgi:hypothetical protein
LPAKIHCRALTKDGNLIIVKLMGGLGNQMFQYAAARRLAWRHETELRLDLSFLESDQRVNTPREFVLDKLRINAERASRHELGTIARLGGNLLEKMVTRFCRMIRPNACHSAVYREKFFHFDPSVMELPDNSYIEGYWQSERYFSDIKDILLTEFSIKSPLTGKNLEYVRLVQAENSVSIHVRRGDYVLCPTVHAYHGTCSLQYYHDAVQVIASRVRDPHFFVFSDDPCWVKDNLKVFPHPMTVVEHNGADKGYEDLRIRIMSQCRHNIIANSSLSWWGAWLSTVSEKIIIAPRQWFNDPSINTADLIPSSWLRM